MNMINGNTPILFFVQIKKISFLYTFLIAIAVSVIMDGGVVAAVSPDALDIVKYGIVTGTGTQTYSDQYGSSCSAETVTVACTDGTSNTYQYANSAFSAGSFVRVTIAGGSVAIVSPGTVSLSGTVNSAATTLGSYAFADDIQIMTSEPWTRIVPFSVTVPSFSVPAIFRVPLSTSVAPEATVSVAPEATVSVAPEATVSVTPVGIVSVASDAIVQFALSV